MKKDERRTIGYLRVSTADQDLEKNKADILVLVNTKGLSRVEWVEDKVSGTLDWRKRKIGETLEGLKAGDTVIVSELSRLGRSVLQILEIMQVAKQKGISVFAVKGGWSMNGSMESKIVLHMFAMIAEIERDLISERTKEGLRAKKALGVKLGRPKGPGRSKLDPFKEEISALLRTGSKQTYVSKKYNCTPATLNNWIKKNKISTEAVF